jgi:NADH pyrophosphatase NudC (nudix superfamily)
MMKNAVMIVLEDNGKFLLGKRAEWKAKAPGYWCPISGHIEESESEEEAVVREAKEELAITVRAVRKITSTPTHDKTVMLHWWMAEILSGSPAINNNENSDIKWFTRDELRSLQPVYLEDIEILLKAI